MKTNNYIKNALTLMVVIVLSALLSPVRANAANPATVVDIIVNSENHNTLEAAVVAANLAGTLSGDGPFTVFAPTDAAFAALPAGTLDALLADPSGDLTQILLYHVVGAKAMSTDLSNGQIIATLQGKSVAVTIKDGKVYINNAQVTVADVVADNGVVHVIDVVLLPSRVTVADVIINSENHNTLEAAVGAANLGGALSGVGPFTVFAPTDAAFAALPAGTLDALLADPSGDLTQILLYHVVGAKAMSTDLSNGQTIVTLQGKSVTVTINDGKVYINNAQVTVADIVADNGVVHVIDAVLLPPRVTVADIIINSENHNTLEAAVVAANLGGALSGDGPFTVFAPTDAAFAALPAGTLDALLADPSGDLTQILLYHVVGAKAMSTDLSNGQTIVTLQGKSVTVTINDGKVYINNAQVTVADIVGDNGVVHVIDAVLLPPRVTVADIIINSENHNTLEAAVVAANLGGALSGDGPFTVFAPTDAAFAALPAGTLDALLADPSGDLTQILLYHVVGAKAMSTDLSNGQTIVTLQGKSVTVTINDGKVYINNAQVTVADIVADNGVVHVIDAVLLPPRVTVADIIINSENHNTLEAAVVAANLGGALSGDGPFTVFAPTDAAFAALPAGTLDALLADPSGDLTQILLYHVVGAKALSTDLSNGQTIVTLQGESVTVSFMDGKVYINNAQVTVADVVADNGVVHVIDAVLLPQFSTSVRPSLTAKGVVLVKEANKLKINLAASAQTDLNVSIVDLTGREVLSSVLYKGQDSKYLAIDSLPKGIYLVKLGAGNSAVVTKFMK
jgi:transforming growth factor-beta-induced protein